MFEKDCENWLRDVFWKTVNEREKTNENRSDLIGTLISLKNQTMEDQNISKNFWIYHFFLIKKTDFDLKNSEFTGDSLVAQAAIFFTAGNESSSTTMSFLLYELAMHPEIQVNIILFI